MSHVPRICNRPDIPGSTGYRHIPDGVAHSVVLPAYHVHGLGCGKLAGKTLCKKRLVFDETQPADWPCRQEGGNFYHQSLTYTKEDDLVHAVLEGSSRVKQK